VGLWSKSGEVKPERTSPQRCLRRVAMSDVTMLANPRAASSDDVRELYLAAL